MAIDAAVLRAKVEVAGVQQAQAQLQGFGAQIGTVGNQAKAAGGGVTQLGGAADAAGQKVAGAGKQAGLLNTVMGDMSAKSLLMGAGLAGVGLQAANMGKQMVGAAIDWESSLAGIAKTLDTTGLSVEEADAAVVQMGDDIRQMALDIPIAATELAGVAEAAGQLGIARDDVVAFTETMAKLGVATDLTAEQAATSIARITNITGLATSEVDNFGSALVDLGNNSAATESEILAMATRIAAAGSMAGLTEGEILGLSVALTSVGINAEAGGTAITQVMNEIEVSVESADERLTTFAEIAGMSAEQFAEAWRTNPNEALVSFVEGLGQVTATGGSTVQILDELGLDGIRVSQALNSAAGAGDLMRDSMDRGNTAMEENVALNREAEQRFETTASKIQLFKNNLNELNLALAEGYLPAMNDALDVTLLWAGEVQRVMGDAQELRTNFLDLGSAIAEYNPLAGIAGDNTGSLGDVLRQTVESAVPMLSTMHLAKDVVGLFGGETARTTELTKAQAAALNEWVAIIEGAIPGTQSQHEATRQNNAAMADYEQQIRDASAATLESAQSSIAYAEAQQAMTAEGHRGVQMATDMGVAVDDLDRAFSDLDTSPLVEGLQNFGEMQDLFQQNIENASIGVSEWQGHLSGAEEALGFLNAQIERGEPLTAAQQAQYDTLTEASERYTGGIEDEAEALIDAEVAKANFVKIQDELNAALESGEITQAEYNDAVGAAAAELDPATAASMGLVEAQEALATGVQGTVDKMALLLFHAGLISETEAEAIIGADITEAQANVDHMEGRLETYEGIVSTATADVDDSSAVARIDGVEGELNAYAGAVWTTTVSADVSAAEAEIARIKGIISSGAILPVAISASENLSGFASGTGPSGTTRNQLAWVGELGPELAWLPEGTHVLPSDESRKFAALMGQMPGFQDGTGGSLPGAPGGASAGSLPGSPPPPPHGGSMGVDWEAIAAAEAEAWVAAWGDAVDAAMSDNPAGFVENIQDEINDLRTKLDLAPALGVPEAVVAGWQADLAGLQGESAAFWQTFAEGIASGLIDPAVLEELDEAGQAQLDAYLTPIVGEEGAQKIIDGIGAVTQITAEGLGQLRTIFEEDTEAAVGSITWADAMGLMAEVPRDDLLPVLEDLEQQFEDDLVQAILATDDAAQAVAEQGLAMVADALANINTELGDLMGFSDDFARRGSGGVGVITSGGGGGGSSGGGGSTGGGDSRTRIASRSFGASGSASGMASVDDADREFTGTNWAAKVGGDIPSFMNSMSPSPYLELDEDAPREEIWRIIIRRMMTWLAATGWGADEQRKYGTFNMAQFARDEWLPDTHGLASLSAIIDDINTRQDVAFDFMQQDPRAGGYFSFGPSGGVPRFADGGVTLGSSLAILGDNPSGREMVLPFERNQEFARSIAQELAGVLGGGGAPIIIESLVVGDEKIQGPFATRVAGKIFQGSNSRLHQSGIPMNINRR